MLSTLRLFRSTMACGLLALLVPTLTAQRVAVEARHGVVASAHVLASQAGIEILKKGGNAVDAAVATGLALTVVYPVAGNIGGGGFMVIHLANGGQHIIDYRETAPAAATRDMYLDADGKLLNGPGSSTVGWRASGVPGSVAGFALALEKYGSGKVSWAEVCEPARRLAAEGHAMTQTNAHSLRAAAKHLGRFPESRRVYLKDGSFYQTGEWWVQSDLGETFARLQKFGPREFYEGETARRIAKAMAEHGGTLSLEDLKRYRAVEREPLRGTYRGYEIVTMPPPSSGGIALLQMLTMIEPHDVAALGHDSSEKYHLFIEAMKRAFRDRAEYLADPDFAPVPVTELLDPAYLQKRFADFSPERTRPAADIAPGLGKAPVAATPLKETLETTHYSVVDAEGNAVANTYTLNGAYGSGVTIPGTGILMNNEMDDFTSKPGAPNKFGLIQGDVNSIAPHKRPLSAMTPTLVFKDGKLVLVTGSPGGPTIINTVLQVVTNIVDFKMTPMQAVEAPRIHHQWMPDVVTYEKLSMSTDTIRALEARGHTVRMRESYEGTYQGDAETIYLDGSGLRHGAADPRKGDSAALGY